MSKEEIGRKLGKKRLIYEFIAVECVKFIFLIIYYIIIRYFLLLDKSLFSY